MIQKKKYLTNEDDDLCSIMLGMDIDEDKNKPKKEQPDIAFEPQLALEFKTVSNRSTIYETKIISWNETMIYDVNFYLVMRSRELCYYKLTLPYLCNPKFRIAVKALLLQMKKL